MNKKTGMFWHCHHDILCEYVHDYQERVDYIKKNKPEHEIKTRLKLFQPVQGKLPQKYVEAGKKLVEAWEKYYEACKKYDEAWEKFDEAWENFVEARNKYFEAWKKYKPKIEKLHKKECGCKEWDSEKEEVVFE